MTTAMRSLRRYWPLFLVMAITATQIATLGIFEPDGGSHWDAGWGGAPGPLSWLARSSTYGPVMDAIGVLAVAAAARLLKRLWSRLTLAVRVGATLYLAGQVANFTYRVFSPWIAGDLGVANLWSGAVGNVGDLAIACALPAGLATWATPHVSAWLRQGRWRPGFHGLTGAFAGMVVIAGAGGAWATGAASHEAQAHAAAVRAKAEAKVEAAQLRAEAARQETVAAVQQAQITADLKLAEAPDGLSWDNPPAMATGGSVNWQPVSGPAALAGLQTEHSNWVVLVGGPVQTPALQAWLALPGWAQTQASTTDLANRINPDVVSAGIDGLSAGHLPSEANLMPANPPWWLANDLAALGNTGS